MPGKLLMLDFDGTVVSTEGLDELAAHKLTPRSQQSLKGVTEAAMSGKCDFAASLKARMDVLKPSEEDCRWLSERYFDTLCPDAQQALQAVADDGWQVAVVSGGLAPSIAPVARTIIPPDALVTIVANEPLFDNRQYCGLSSSSPGVKGETKGATARTLRAAGFGPIVLLGDGANDAEACNDVDAFFCFTQVAERPAVAAKAQQCVSSFAGLRKALADFEGCRPPKDCARLP